MKFPWFSSSAETLVTTTTSKITEPVVTIPPALPGRIRTLVLCFDGTGDQDDKDNTNVVEFREMLKESEEEQLFYYQRGIGTYIPKIPGIKEPVNIPGLTLLSETWDKATAWSLEGHVTEAYKWLVDHYQEGDKICMFGFSRGSYTARATAGMLFKVGLLPTKNRDQADAAFKSYQAAATVQGWEASSGFQKDNKSIDVRIEFLGCWDTVNSVGSWTTKSLPFTAYNPLVRTFRHAVALDERRAKFRTNLWSPGHEAQPGADNSGATDLQKIIRSFIEEKSKGWLPTHVDEVWFTGCHCDIGGGSVANGTKPNLAHIPLRWMIRQCFERETGIMFLKDKLESFHLYPDTLYPVAKDRPPALDLQGNQIQPPTRLGPIDTVKGWFKSINPFGASSKPQPIRIPTNEEEADVVDALAPIYDMLDIKPQIWLIFEKMPFKVYNAKLGKVVDKVYNKQPRDLRGPIFVDMATKVITKAPVKVHRTVLTRMQSKNADGSFYVPRALFLDGTAISLDDGLTAGQAKFDWVG